MMSRMRMRGVAWIMSRMERMREVARMLRRMERMRGSSQDDEENGEDEKAWMR